MRGVAHRIGCAPPASAHLRPPSPSRSSRSAPHPVSIPLVCPPSRLDPVGLPSIPSRSRQSALHPDLRSRRSAPSIRRLDPAPALPPIPGLPPDFRGEGRRKNSRNLSGPRWPIGFGSQVRREAYDRKRSRVFASFGVSILRVTDAEVTADVASVVARNRQARAPDARSVEPRASTHAPSFLPSPRKSGGRAGDGGQTWKIRRRGPLGKCDEGSALASEGGEDFPKACGCGCGLGLGLRPAATASFYGQQ